MPKENQLINGTADLVSPSSSPTGLFYIQQRLTDEDIKALPTTSFVLVPKPGPGFVNILVRAIATSNFSAGAYDNVDGSATIGIYYGDADGNASNRSVDGDPFFADDSDSLLLNFTPATVTPNPNDPGSAIEELSITRSIAEDNDLRISVNNNGAGDFEGGDPANEMVVTLLYFKLPL